MSPQCLARQGELFVAVGSGGPSDAVTGALPAKACRQFGPEVPEAAACSGAESYASFDPVTQTVRARREGMRLSWFATAGVLDEDHTGRDEADEATWSENAWTAPAATGLAHLWVVLRDDRGGVGWRAYTFDVR